MCDASTIAFVGKRAVLLQLVLAGLGCSAFGTADSAPTDAGASTSDGGANDAASVPDVAPTSRYRDAVMVDGPIAYFRLGEASGSVVRSEVKPWTGTLPIEGASFGAKGAITADPDTALLLTGKGSVSLGKSFDFTGKSPFTFEVWLRADTIDGKYRMVFNKELDVSGSQYDMHNVYVHTDVVGFERYVGGNELTVATKLLPNQLAHVVATYDGAAIAIYIDGELGERKLDTRSASEKNVDFLVGGAFVGILDEVAIYDKALAPERIKAHFQAGSSP
jgi:hypothetical protein